MPSGEVRLGAPKWARNSSYVPSMRCNCIRASLQSPGPRKSRTAGATEASTVWAPGCHRTGHTWHVHRVAGDVLITDDLRNVHDRSLHWLRSLAGLAVPTDEARAEVVSETCGGPGGIRTHDSRIKSLIRPSSTCHF